MNYMSQALITLPRVGNLPPFPLSMTDTVIISQTWAPPAVCMRACAPALVCVGVCVRSAGWWEMEHRGKKMKVWGLLPFFPLKLFQRL